MRVKTGTEPKMDTAAVNKPFLPFGWKLFISVMSLFIVFSICFIAYQYRREKEYKVELLNSRLQDYNDRLVEVIWGKDSIESILDKYIERHPIKKLRVTVINLQGKVIYESTRNEESYDNLENHIQRKEIKKALQEGTGYDVRRTSEITGLPYFYSAKKYDNQLIIRSALPYTLTLANRLRADSHFIWFTVIVTLFLIFIFYKFTQKLGTSITQLREFAMRADRNEPIDPGTGNAFPQNELGEISQHIIQIYKHLHEAKEALYIEREKLITHLQISHEGLGIFTHDKKEILVNNLFTQFTNLISDHNLERSEEVFTVPEFQSITDFINKKQQRPAGKKEKRMSISLDKDGRTFTIECIIFQDLSFEISINDVTQEEEQIRLKRQLTQNIAHELKTPVSSIQGYLETIVGNENLPKEKLNVFLERCYAQSNRLTRLLKDISVLTRIDEAPGMIDMEKADITLMVKNIINEVSLELEEKQMTVADELNKEIMLRGNASLLYSIFRNLMDNSIAYAGRGAAIKIKCFREDKKFYYFSFSDTGAGVPPEHLARLFERFYRVDKGRSRKIGGTGLGLAIVKNAVIIHGGNISVKNNRGGGLEFIFTLAKD